MECDKIKILIQLYLNSETTTDEKLLIDEHIKICPICEAYLRDQSLVRKTIRNKISIPPAPEELRKSVFDLVTTYNKPKKLRDSLFKVSAVIFSAAAIFIFVWTSYFMNRDQEKKKVNQNDMLIPEPIKDILSAYKEFRNKKEGGNFVPISGNELSGDFGEIVNRGIGYLTIKDLQKQGEYVYMGGCCSDIKKHISVLSFKETDLMNNIMVAAVQGVIPLGENKKTIDGLDYASYTSDNLCAAWFSFEKSTCIVVSSLNEEKIIELIKTMHEGLTFQSEFTLDVGKMRCQMCVKKINNSLEKVKGVRDVEIDLINGTVKVIADLYVSEESLIESVSGCGFDVYSCESKKSKICREK